MLARKCAPLLLMVIMLWAVGMPGAAADPSGFICDQWDGDGNCIGWVVAPPSGGGGVPVPGPGDPDPGGGSGGSGGSPSPCTYQLASPQPAASDPAWGGNTPADGAIYLEVCPRPDGYGSGYRTSYVFLANGAAPPAGPPIDPRVLAEQAIFKMTFLAPPIQMMPPQGSEGAITGVPAWMWVTPGVTTTGPQTASASAGGITVTATGIVTQVLWEMGDGAAVPCGIGTPYDPSYGGDPSPTCGYVYEVKSTKDDPNGVYTVTATSTWTITWSGGGQSGVEVMDLSSSVPLRVTEINVINVPGG